MRVLVVGASGFIGGALVQALGRDDRGAIARKFSGYGNGGHAAAR